MCVCAEAVCVCVCVCVFRSCVCVCVFRSSVCVCVCVSTPCGSTNFARRYKHHLLKTGRTKHLDGHAEKQQTEHPVRILVSKTKNTREKTWLGYERILWTLVDVVKGRTGVNARCDGACASRLTWAARGRASWRRAASRRTCAPATTRSLPTALRTRRKHGNYSHMWVDANDQSRSWRVRSVTVSLRVSHTSVRHTILIFWCQGLFKTMVIADLCVTSPHFFGDRISVQKGASFYTGGYGKTALRRTALIGGVAL